jgi:predicted aspartyl protease
MRLIPKRGVMQVSVKVTDLVKRSVPYEAQFLVNTGSIDCLAPSDRLQAAGIQPEGKRQYKTASGQSAEHEYGFALLSFLGKETVAQIIFGPLGVEPFLGAAALNSAGMVVDPATNQIRQLRYIPLK